MYIRYFNKRRLVIGYVVEESPQWPQTGVREDIRTPGQNLQIHTDTNVHIRFAKSQLSLTPVSVIPAPTAIQAYRGERLKLLLLILLAILEFC